MMYTQQEVIDFVNNEDVKFIRLCFFNVFGHQKNVSILPSQLPKAFSEGIGFDAEAIDGFDDQKYNELFLRPDPKTVSFLPWRSYDGAVIRMYCDIYKSDGTLYHEPRFLLKEAVKSAKAKNLDIEISSEFEFYLFCLDEDGNVTDRPLDQAGYMDIAPLDQGEDVRRQICSYLSEMDIEPLASHHERGPGQNEIDFISSTPLQTADNIATFRWIVKTVAQANGLSANFSPKPLKDKAGSSMHIILSLKEHRNEFIAGILSHMKELSLFLNRTQESHLRLSQQGAPNLIAWDYQSHDQVVRLSKDHGRIELRSPDGKSNSYLAFMLLIYAGLDGIEKEMDLHNPMDATDTLPASIEEAKQEASNSEFIRRYVPETILTAYLR